MDESNEYSVTMRYGLALLEASRSYFKCEYKECISQLEEYAKTRKCVGRADFYEYADMMSRAMAKMLLPKVSLTYLMSAYYIDVIHAGQYSHHLFSEILHKLASIGYDWTYIVRKLILFSMARGFQSDIIALIQELLSNNAKDSILYDSIGYILKLENNLLPHNDRVIIEQNQLKLLSFVEEDKSEIIKELQDKHLKTVNSLPVHTRSYFFLPVKSDQALCICVNPNKGRVPKKAWRNSRPKAEFDHHGESFDVGFHLQLEKISKKEHNKKIQINTADYKWWILFHEQILARNMMLPKWHRDGPFVLHFG